MALPFSSVPGIRLSPTASSPRFPIRAHSDACQNGSSPSSQSHISFEGGGGGGGVTAKKKRCLRCGIIYGDRDNSPVACSFHGHITGERGLFALAPPHQGIDGEWSDRSGVIVYRWNERGARPNTGSTNWKKRWSCCSEYDHGAPPCRRGRHVSYDDGFTLY